MATNIPQELNAVIQEMKNGSVNLFSDKFNNAEIASWLESILGVNILSIADITVGAASVTQKDNYSYYEIDNGTITLFGKENLNIEKFIIAQEKGKSEVNFVFQISLDAIISAFPFISGVLEGIVPSKGVDFIFATSDFDNTIATDFGITEVSTLSKGVNVAFNVTESTDVVFNEGVFKTVKDQVTSLPGFPSVSFTMNGSLVFGDVTDIYAGPSQADVTVTLGSGNFELFDSKYNVSTPRFTVKTKEVTSDGETYNKVTCNFELDLNHKDGNGQYTKMASLVVQVTKNMTLWSFDFEVAQDFFSSALSGSLSDFSSLIPVSNTKTPKALLQGVDFIWKQVKDLVTDFKFSGLKINALLSIPDGGGGSPSFSITSVSTGLSLAKPITVFDEVKITSLNTHWRLSVINGEHNWEIDFAGTASLINLEGIGTLSINANSDGTITATDTGFNLVKFLGNVDINLPSSWSGDSLTIPYLSVTRYADGDYELSGELDANLQLFGESHFLGVKNGKFDFTKSSSDWTGNFSGTLEVLDLDFEVQGKITDKDSSFSINLQNQTLGSLLQYMLGFIGFENVQFDGAWSVLNDINLDDFIVTYDITNKTVTLEYDINLSFSVIDIESISLTYDHKVTDEHKKVMFHLAGDFLGKSYALPSANDSSKPTLGWSPSDPSTAPQTPGGSSVLDLRYIGLGQHLTLDNVADINSMSQAINELKNAFKPSSGSSANGSMPEGVHMDPQAGWLAGADFTLLDAISLSMIFDDPSIYGLKIALSGPKMKALAGLSFEIIYKKISKGLGEYEMKLTLPTMMRHISVGEASITLPTIGLDIYTNSDFQIDFGFPYHNNFLQSAGLDIFPFAGQGGFYFGKLPAAAVSTLPDVDGKGRFTPIIDFGFGLQVGVGFSASYGPISVNADLGIHGILQGLVSYFHPWSLNYPDSFYFAIKADVGIQGWLKGKADFVIISASVDIDLEADATLNYVEYENIEASASAELSASASVHFLFFTTHFSVHVHFHKSFTLGHATTPPWATLPPPPPPASHSPAPPLLSSFLAEVAPVAPGGTYTKQPTIDWSNSFNYGTPLTITAYTAPTITAGGASSTPTTSFFTAFELENPNPASSEGSFNTGTDFAKLSQAVLAWTISVFKAEADWSTLKDETVSVLDLEIFNGWITGELPLLIFTQLGFTQSHSKSIHHYLLQHGYLDKGSIFTTKYTATKPTIDFTSFRFVSVQKSTEINAMLQNFVQPVQWFDSADLESFFKDNSNVTFNVNNSISSVVSAGKTLSSTLMPIPTSLSISCDNATVKMANQTISDKNKLTYLNEYLSKAAETEFNTLPSGETVLSVGEYLFLDYFQLLASTALLNAQSLLRQYPYKIKTTTSLSGLSDTCLVPSTLILEYNINDENILNTTNGWVALPENNIYVSKAATTISTLFSARYYQVPSNSAELGDLIPLSDFVLANLSQPNIFEAGQTLSISGYSYTPPTQDQTITNIAALFGVDTKYVETFVTPVPGEKEELEAGTKVKVSGITYKIPATGGANTLELLAIQFGVTPISIVAVNTLESTELTATIAPNTAIKIDTAWYTVLPTTKYDIQKFFGLSTAISSDSKAPYTLDISYSTKSNDSILSMAQQLAIFGFNNQETTPLSSYVTSVESLILNRGQEIQIPSHAVKINAGDSIGDIANDHQVSLSDLTELNKDSTMLLSGSCTVIIPATTSYGDLIEKFDTYYNDSPIGAALVSQAMNRFLKSGLRIPNPDDLTLPSTSWGGLETYSIFALSGNQFDVATPKTVNALTLSFNETTPKTWLTIPTSKADKKYSFSADEMNLVHSLGGSLLALNPNAPQQYWGWKNKPEKFAVIHSIPFQTPAQIAGLSNVNGKNPLVWTLPQSLQQSLSNPENAAVTYTVNKGWWKAGKVSDVAQESEFVWASRFSIKARSTSKVSDMSGGAGTLYILSIDNQTKEDIGTLENWVKNNGTLSYSLDILYKTGAEGGLTSTVTAADLENLVVFSMEETAGSEPLSFVDVNVQKVLQTLQTDAYLEYSTALSPEGFPASLFKGNPEGSIEILVKISAVAGAQILPPTTNCLLTNGNINSNNQVLSIESSNKTYHPTLPLGAVAFEIPKFAAPKVKKNSDYKGMLKQMYQMIGYHNMGLDGANPEIEGLPVVPMFPEGSKGVASEWLYRKVVKLDQMNVPDLTTFESTPSADNNPYAKTILNNGVPQYDEYKFHLRDLFGFQYVPTNYESPFNLGYLYNDALIGVGQWPHVTTSFDFSNSGTSQAPIAQFNFHLNFSVAKYLAQPNESFVKLKNSILTDLSKYQKIYYQINQADVSAVLTSEVCGVTEAGSAYNPLPTLQTFVTDIYGFLGTLGYLMENDGLSNQTYAVSKSEDILSVASKLNISPSELLALNQNLPGIFADGDTISLPIVYAVKHGDTFNSIQSYLSQQPGYLGSSTIQIAELNQHNADVLREGAQLTISGHSSAYAIKQGDTLSSIVEAFGLNLSELIDAGTSVKHDNLNVSIFKVGAVLTVETSTYTFAANSNVHQLATTDMTWADILSQAVQQNHELSIHTIPNYDEIIAINTSNGIKSAQALALQVPNHLKLNIGSYDGDWVKQISETTFDTMELADLLDWAYANYYISGLVSKTAIPVVDITAEAGRSSQSLSIAPEVNDQSTLESVYTSFVVSTVQQLLAVSGVTSGTTTILKVTIGGSTTSLDIDYALSDSVTILSEKVKTILPFNLFVQLIDFKTLMTTGAYYLQPPASVTKNLGTVQHIPAKFSKITSALQLSRDEALVSGTLPEPVYQMVQGASAEVALHLAGGLNDGSSRADHYTANDLSVKDFANVFQSIFPEYLVATAPAGTQESKYIHAAPVGPKSIDVGVEALQQQFFLNKPLSSQLVSYTFGSVQTYSSQGGLSKASGQFTVQSIDMDDWAKKFLKTFDQVLSPKNLSTINANDPNSFNTLLSSRASLVETIGGSVSSILTPNNDPTRVAQAKIVFKDQLEKSLSNAYKIDSIVQLKTNTTPQTSALPVNPTLSGIAEAMGVSLSDLLLYNINNTILKQKESITIEKKSYATGATKGAYTSFLSWMNTAFSAGAGHGTTHADVSIADIVTSFNIPPKGLDQDTDGSTVTAAQVILSNLYSNIVQSGKSFTVGGATVSSGVGTESLFVLMQGATATKGANHVEFLDSVSIPKFSETSAFSALEAAKLILSSKNTGNPSIGVIQYHQNKPATGTYGTVKLTSNINLYELAGKIEKHLKDKVPHVFQSAFPSYAAAEIVKSVSGLIVPPVTGIPYNAFGSSSAKSIPITATDTLEQIYTNTNVKLSGEGIDISFYKFFNILSQNANFLIDSTAFPTMYFEWKAYGGTETPKTSLKDYFLKNSIPDFQPAALEELGTAPGVLGNISSIGVLQFCAKPEPGYVTIQLSDLPGGSPPQLVKIATAIKKAITPHGTSLPFSLQNYMVGEALRHANIVEGGKTLSISGTNVTTKNKDSLQQLYQQFEGTALSFSYFVNQVMANIDILSSEFPLYFKWQYFSDSVETSNLALSGKVNADTYQVQSENNNLEGILTHLDGKYFGHAHGDTSIITKEYLGEILQDEVGLLQPGSVTLKDAGSNTHQYTIPQGQTLSTFFQNIKTADSVGHPAHPIGYTSYTDFINKSEIFSQNVLVSGKVLFMSWLQHGNPLTISSVAQLLGTSWQNFIRCNYNNAVAYKTQGDSTAVPLAQIGALWQSNQTPVALPPAIIASPGHLDPTSKMGMLSYVGNDTGQFEFYSSKAQSFSGFAAIVIVDDVHFYSGFIGSLISGLKGIFSAEDLVIGTGTGSKLKTSQLSEMTLIDIYNHYNSSNKISTEEPQTLSSEKINEIELFAVQHADKLMMIAKKFTFHWTEVKSLASSQTISQVSGYFDVTNEELIKSNWNNPYFVNEGVEIVGAHTYITKPKDTLAIIAQNVLGGAKPTVKNFYNLSVVALNSQLMSWFSLPGVLALQPQTSLTGSSFGLSVSDYLTFALTQTGEPERRIGLDFDFTAQTVDVQGRGGEPTVTYSLISPQKFQLDDLEIPIPLRAFPGMPTMVNQNITLYEPIANQKIINEEQPVMSIEDAKSWVYDFEYRFDGASQDEVILNFNLSDTASNSDGTTGYNEALFKKLGAFMQVYPLLSQDLSYLENVQGKTDSVAIKNAIQVFTKLASEITTAWKPASPIGDGELSQHEIGASHTTKKPLSFTFKIEELYDATVNELTINVSSLELFNLPGNYVLPLIVPDPSVWKSKGENAPPIEGRQVTYTYTQISDTTDTGLRKVTFENHLDVTTYHYANTNISVQRNANLLAGSVTSPKFIFQTPSVGFQAAVVPLIERHEEIRFSPNLFEYESGQTSMENRLNQMFDEVLPKDASNEIQYAVSYQFDVSKSGFASIQSYVPVEFQHKVERSALDVATLATKLDDLIESQGISGGDFVFDIAVYSTPDKKKHIKKKPILKLKDVRMSALPEAIQEERVIPFEDLNQLPWATDPDAINPLVTNISRYADVTIDTATKNMLSYGGPLRIKSWTGGMTWNNNKLPFYNLKKAIARQVPIYADPLIGVYIAKLAADMLGPKESTNLTNYNDYFAQAGQTADGDDSVYVKEGWEAGFHLSMPNPTMNNGAAYNSGTGLKTYNNDLLIYNAGNPNVQSSINDIDDWTGATYKGSHTPTNDSGYSKVKLPDFTKAKGVPEGAYQSGLCQYGIWRDTLAVNPVSKAADGSLQLAFAPQTAKICEQGDFHAEFVMEDDTVGVPTNRQLRMRMVLGSPYAQFTGTGLDGIRIEGIFNPKLASGDKATITKGGILPSTDVKTITLANGKIINYVVICQQVNMMHIEKIPLTGKERMNWVSFAVYWDPAKMSHQMISTGADNLGLYLLFNSPGVENFVAIAGLPSQMKNTYSPPSTGNQFHDLDQSAVTAWAKELGYYAFNWVKDTHVSYANGTDRAGRLNSTVNTSYTVDLEQVGPVKSIDDTVLLLQPHQYLDPQNPADTVLQEGSLKELFSAGDEDQGSYDYWISRGNLKTKLGSEFTISYDYPNLLPYMPSLKSDSKTHGDETYNLIEMAAAMIGYEWVADFPDSSGEPQDGPATTGMSNPFKMQGSYNAGKTFFRASKIIAMLYEMYDESDLQTLGALRNISGPSKQTPGGWSIYSVGAVVKNKVPEFYSPGQALQDFIDHLFDAFAYYFGGNPAKYLARSMDAGEENTVSGKSYYYSYYDKMNHHLFVYPASGAGGIWPSNKPLLDDYAGEGPDGQTPMVFDGYGTVSALNDHAYTYGYLISAAALLGMIINSEKFNEGKDYTPLVGTDTLGSSVPIASTKIAEWKAKFETLQPIVDQMVMDLAYDPSLDREGIFKGMQGMSYPKMEFMDQWSGFSWTDGFPYNGLAGHNVNSPWEQMLAWTGIIYWGQATQRPKLVDLGTYLYTTALYNLEVYRYNVPQSYIPTSNGADESVTGDYLTAATNDFLDSYDFYPGGADGSGIYQPLTFQQQNFKGKTMWETMMSDSKSGALSADKFPYYDDVSDHRTAHVTYIYQSSVRCDNTYWNSALGMLSTSIYPQGANSLVLSRNRSYMSDWVNAIHFQNKKAYYQLSYPTTINLLAGLLGLDVFLAGKDKSGDYLFDSSGSEGSTLPIPGKLGDWSYSPQASEHAKNPQENAFMYMGVGDVKDVKSPYDWFWKLCVGINSSISDSGNTNPPWKNGTTGETLSMYIPADKTGAEVLQYLYSFNKYGTPVFNQYGVVSWVDTGHVGTPMVAMMAVWELPPTAGGDDQHAYMVYHTNKYPVTVTFYKQDGTNTFTTPSLNPFSLYNSQESGGGATLDLSDHLPEKNLALDAVNPETNTNGNTLYLSENDKSKHLTGFKTDDNKAVSNANIIHSYLENAIAEHGDGKPIPADIPAEKDHNTHVTHDNNSVVAKREVKPSSDDGGGKPPEKSKENNLKEGLEEIKQDVNTMLEHKKSEEETMKEKFDKLKEDGGSVIHKAEDGFNKTKTDGTAALQKSEDDLQSSHTRKAFVLVIMGLFALSTVIWIISSFVDQHKPQPLIFHFEGIKSMEEIEFVRQEYSEIVPITTKEGKLEFLLSAPASIVGKMDMTQMQYTLLKDSVVSVTLPEVILSDVLIDLNRVNDYYNKGHSLNMFLSGGGRVYGEVYSEIIDAIKEVKKGVLGSAIKNDIIAETKREARAYMINMAKSLGYRIEFNDGEPSDSFSDDLKKRMGKKVYDKVKNKIESDKKVKPVEKIFDELTGKKKSSTTKSLNQ